MAEDGDLAKVKSLLASGADARAVDRWICRASSGCEARARQIVEELVAAGADVKAETFGGFHPCSSRPSTATADSW